MASTGLKELFNAVVQDVQDNTQFVFLESNDRRIFPSQAVLTTIMLWGIQVLPNLKCKDIYSAKDYKQCNTSIGTLEYGWNHGDITIYHNRGSDNCVNNILLGYNNNIYEIGYFACV